MSTIKNTIQELKQIDLESFDIDVGRWQAQSRIGGRQSADRQAGPDRNPPSPGCRWHSDDDGHGRTAGRRTR